MKWVDRPEITKWIDAHCGPNLNVELLKKVLAKIEEEPRRMNMGVWISKFNECEIKSYPHLPACGTVACLAGWTCLCDDNRDNNFSISARACNTLRLRSQRLFFVDSWPEFFAQKYYSYSSANPIGRAKVVCEFLQCVIDHYKGA